MDNIKYIILDFGKVLAGPTTGNWFITPKLLELIDINLIDIDKFNKLVPTYAYLLDKKITTIEEEYNMIYEFYYKLLTSLDYPNIDENIISAVAYDFTHTTSKYTIYDDTKEVLKELSNNYKLLLLSDNWPCAYNVLKEFGIYDYFDNIYISSIYGYLKRDKVFFDYPINDYNIKKGEAIFIDDNESLLDIAKEKGLDTRLMVRNNNEVVSNHKVIRRLNEIFNNEKCLL